MTEKIETIPENTNKEKIKKVKFYQKIPKFFLVLISISLVWIIFIFIFILINLYENKYNCTLEIFG
jgi:hypothetical protein